MGRYTLVMDTFEKQKISISLKEGSKKKTKVSLKTIDDLTKFFMDVINKLEEKNGK